MTDLVAGNSVDAGQTFPPQQQDRITNRRGVAVKTQLAEFVLISGFAFAASDKRQMRPSRDLAKLAPWQSER
jgi:hypothetical protein